jgi:hypothetical protein
MSGRHFDGEPGSEIARCPMEYVGSGILMPDQAGMSLWL